MDCANVPVSSEAETGFATGDTNTLTGTTPNTTPYVYVEPNVVLQQTIDAAEGTTGGHVVMTTDGNIAVYRMNEEDTAAHPKAQMFYRSTDGGDSWQQRGSLPLATNQCASSLTVIPKSYGVNAAHRLVYAETSCESSPTPGGATANCIHLVFTSDDGASTWAQAGNASTVYTTDYCSNSMAVDDVGAVHLVYSAQGANSPNQVMHNVSTDGGQSWGANGVVATVNNQPRWPTIVSTRAAGSHQLFVTFEQVQPDANARWTVGAVVSNDNGASWSAPTQIIAPVGNEMMSAPSVAVLDANTVVSTYYHTVGDRSSTLSTNIGLAFGKTQARDVPVYGTRFSLGTIDTFPPTIVVLSSTTLLVAAQVSNSTGPVFQKVTLHR